MKHTMRAGCGVEAVSSTKQESKEPSDGPPIGSTCNTDYSVAQSGRFLRSCVSFHPVGRPFTGLFISSRTPHDSNAPHPGGSEENGIGICESLSQRCNSEIIRLARRNHKPGGADLAGSVHVVRSLSG